MEQPKAPTYADALAGFDLSQGPVTTEDLLPPTYQGSLNNLTDQQQRDDNYRRANTTFGDKLTAIARDMPIVQPGLNAWDMWSRNFEPDPTFNAERLDARLKEAQKTLEPDYLPWLQGVSSDAEFDHFFARAKELQESRRTLQEAEGLGWGAIWFASQVIDPTNLAVGTAMIKGGLVAQRGVSSVLAARGVNAAAGAVGGVSIEALRAASGIPTGAEDYLMVGGLGLLLGGLAGPIAHNIATASEAQALVRAGKSVQQLLIEGPKPGKSQLDEVYRAVMQEEERRAAQAHYREQQATKGSAPVEEPSIGELRPATPVQQIERGIIDADVEEVVSGAGRLIDETVNPPPRLEGPSPQKALPAPPHEEFPKFAQKMADEPEAPVPPAIDAEFKDIAPPSNEPGPLPAPEKLLSNPNYVGDWLGADGATYRVMTDAESGLYRVTQVGKGTVAKEIATLKEAVERIPLKKAAEPETIQSAPQVGKAPTSRQEAVAAYKAATGRDPPKHLRTVAAIQSATNKYELQNIRDKIKAIQGAEIMRELTAAEKDQLQELVARLGRRGDDPLKPSPSQLPEDVGLDAAIQRVRQEVLGDVVDAMKKVAPKGWGGEVYNSLVNGGYGVSDAAKRIIKVSLASPNAMGTVFHEGVHALRAAGAFTKKEWSKLVKSAKRYRSMNPERVQQYKDQYAEWAKIDPRWANPRLVDKMIEEEMVTHFAQRYMTGERFGGAVDHVMDKALKIFRKLRDILGVKGFRTYQDIFEDIQSGAQAERTGLGEGGVWSSQLPENNRSAANLGPGRPEDALKDPDWRDLGDDKTPWSATFRIPGLGWRILRLDAEVVTGRSRNPVSRLLSGHFFNNAVGMEGHAVNAVAAEKRAAQGLGRYMNEFSNTYWPAWEEWAKDNKVSLKDRMSKQREFRELAGMYIANRQGIGADYHPAVKRLGDKVKALQADQLKDMQNPGWREGKTLRPIAGSENISEFENYLWRQFDKAKVQNVVNLYGFDNVARLVDNALEQAQPWMPVEYRQKLAKGYLHTIYDNSVGLAEDWAEAISTKDFGKLKSLLKQTQQKSALTDDQIEDIIARWRTRPHESGMAHTKRKLFLDESAELEIRKDGVGGDGTVGTLAFRDLLNNDVGELFHRYSRRVQGRVALARIQVKHPDTGKLLVDGITSDAEFEALKRIIREYGTDYLKNRTPQFEKIIEKDLEYFQFIYDRIKGAPDPRQLNDWARWLRTIRVYNQTRLLGQVGIAQLGESGTVVGHLGVKATMGSKIPGFRRIIDAAGDARYSSKITEELDSMAIGGERRHGISWQHLDDLGEMPYEVRSENTWKRHFDNGLGMAQWATYEGSGMNIVQQQQLLKTALMVADTFADGFANKTASGAYKASFKNRIAQLGISEQMMDRIGAAMEQHVGWKSGVGGKKISSLNVDQWTDLEARVAFEEALFRYSTKLIQQHDYGSTAKWMSHPIAQTLFQFRNFPLQAWANQLQYSLHMADFNAFMAFVWSVSWNATVRGAQVATISLGRSDGAEYREKYGSTRELVKAGLERGGQSSILPMGIDTTLALLGQKPIFNARSTGLSQSLLSNPTTEIFNQAQKGFGGVVDSVARGREISQGELRALASLFPLMNQLQFSMLLSTMISGKPTHAPKNEPLL